MRSKHSKQSQLLMYVQDPDEIAMQRQEAWEYMGDVKHFMIMMVKGSLDEKLPIYERDPKSKRLDSFEKRFVRD